MEFVYCYCFLEMEQHVVCSLLLDCHHALYTFRWCLVGHGATFPPSAEHGQVTLPTSHLAAHVCDHLLQGPAGWIPPGAVEMGLEPLLLIAAHI